MEPLEFVEDSRIELTEGDPVVVIGHGMSLPFTASTGHINYTNRFGTGVYTLHLQIDAVVNQGNSGGSSCYSRWKSSRCCSKYIITCRQVPGWDGVGLAVMVHIAKELANILWTNTKKQAKQLNGSYVEVHISLKYSHTMK